jgi:hypothetical protein
MTLLERLAIYGIIAGVVMILATGFYAHYTSTLKANAVLKEQLEEARHVNEENGKALAAKAAEAKALDAVAVLLRKRDQAVLNAITEVRKDLNGLRNTDPQVREWADSKLPPAIAERLRSDVASGEAGSGEGKSPAKPAGAVPRAPAKR